MKLSIVSNIENYISNNFEISNILKHILDHDILYIDIGRFVNSLPNSQGNILWCQHFVLMLPKRQCSNLLGNFSKLTLIAYWKLTFFYIKNILYCKENFIDGQTIVWIDKFPLIQHRSHFEIPVLPV